MTKKVINKVIKAFIIVFNTLYGLLMAIVSVGALYADDYAIRNSLPGFILSIVLVIVVNGINIAVRKYIENY